MTQPNRTNMDKYITKMHKIFKNKEDVLKFLQDICAVVSSIDEEDIKCLIENGMVYSRVTYTDEDKNKRRVSINSIFNNGKKLAIVQHIKDLQLAAKEEQIALIIDENGTLQSVDYSAGGDYDIEELFEYEQIFNKASLYKEQVNSKGLEKALYKLRKLITGEADIRLMNEEQIRNAIEELKRITGEDAIERYKQFLDSIKDSPISMKQNSINEIRQAYVGMSPEDIAREELKFHIKRSQITMTHNKEYSEEDDIER